MSSIEEAVPGMGLRPHFRSLLERWDSTPRQGLPQFAGGQAAFLWRGPDEAFASLYLAAEAGLRDAWNVRRAHLEVAAPPGVRLPTPPGTIVRGFTISPDGTRVAALLSASASELAEPWILAAGTQPVHIPGPTAWYAAPVWEPDGGGIWVLTGKPPCQQIIRCPLGSGQMQQLPLPAELGNTAGSRLALARVGEHLRLAAKNPRTGTKEWELKSGAWHTVAPAAQAGRVELVSDQHGTTATLDGRPAYRLSPAEYVSAFAVQPRADATDLWIQTASPERPSGVFCVDEPVRLSNSSRDSSSRIVHRKVTAVASDGIGIPVIISARASDLGPDGLPVQPLPLILTCYGGFGVTHRTEAEPSVPAWLESGGVYVAAQLRGGGELGEDWHQAGRGKRKMRTILDLIDVAGYLVDTRWTTPAQTVPFGASHGGLVVTAAAFLSPASFGGVVAVAPLLDTVDLHRHGLGKQWLHEFGADGECSDHDRAAYSPVHLLRRLGSAALPPLLCCLMGRDERVDNSAAVDVVTGIRERGDRAWLLHEDRGGHGQRAAPDVLDFSAAVLAFAASISREVRPGSGPCP
ncbi:prolyl oligopeptidase family serine peptidase [Paenarthrobacter sp. YJN-D]|uniref:prolyl oligopeptidase family serine peptidase n=1 Tax=Paenarthrobacter sp. YJN-D TaxID=2735317 RepID=UPI0018785D00|nr:prolyl oligopeptidase family serine peptidase [Paenarthrobacter sp. YJN-D]QOT20077.1 S9 family peptidase [Paenarthrobacter sp. YJN-D]